MTQSENRQTLQRTGAVIEAIEPMTVEERRKDLMRLIRDDLRSRGHVTEEKPYGASLGRVDGLMLDYDLREINKKDHYDRTPTKLLLLIGTRENRLKKFKESEKYNRPLGFDVKEIAEVFSTYAKRETERRTAQRSVTERRVEMRAKIDRINAQYGMVRQRDWSTNPEGPVFAVPSSNDMGVALQFTQMLSPEQAETLLGQALELIGPPKNTLPIGAQVTTDTGKADDNGDTVFADGVVVKVEAGWPTTYTVFLTDSNEARAFSSNKVSKKEVK